MHIMRNTVGLAAAVLASTTLVGSAAAATDKGELQAIETQLRALSAAADDEAADRGSLLSTSNITVQSSACFTDPTGDTMNMSTETYQSYPRADITSICAAHNGGTLSFSLTPATATNPATDFGWTGLTGAMWHLDVNNDRVDDFDIYYTPLGGSVQRSNSSTDLCSASLGFDSSRLNATIPASCVGAPSSFNVSGFYVYDSNPSDSYAPLYADNTTYGGPVTQSTVPVVQPTPTTPTPSTTDRRTGRLAGSDRYSTAVAISKNVFPSGAPIVFLARADAFADALAGGTLSRGPILLVPQCGAVPSVVLAEIRRLGASEVVALGGAGAVCDSVLSQAANA